MDHVIVSTRCKAIGNKSITLEYEIVKTVGDEKIVIASALSVLVMFNYEKKCSIPVPAEWKDAIAKFEGSRF